MFHYSRKSSQKSSLLRDLIPVYAENHKAYKQFYDFLVNQKSTDSKPAIDQDSGIVSLTRSLYLLTCFTRGEYEDYVDVSSCQDEDLDHLTFETFTRLSSYFGIYGIKPDLYNLMELYMIIVHLSGTEMVNQLVPLLPRDKLNYGKFGMAYSLVDNGLIPEANELDLNNYDILRNALKYAAKAEQIFATGKKITFNSEFSESEQRIVYTGVVCELSALLGSIEVSGSLTLTESLATDLQLALHNRNNPEYIGYLCCLGE